jgi:uncharacterized damage-inducible protein DinB
MDPRTLIRANLSSVRKELSEVFPHLTDDLLDWAPTDAMRTIQGQLVEIMATEQNAYERLSGLPRRPYEEVEAPFWEIKSVSGLIEKLTEIRNQTLRLLDSIDDGALNAPAETSTDFADWLELHPVPVSEVFRFLARHESYHCGQLVSYLWARGNNPYDWE